MTQRQSLATWIRKNVRPTDGPGAGRPLRLEPWQRGLLDAIDREHKPIVAVRAASQIGKTLCLLGVGLRCAVDGDGTLLASSTGDTVSDMRRRLDRVLELSPSLLKEWRQGPSRGPGAQSWKDRKSKAGGWLSVVTAGSPSQLAARTARVAIADEVARWPARVRSGEGHPLAILRARLMDWGDDGRLIAISSPTVANDAISLLHDDGDRRVLRYSCLDCQEPMRFVWENVVGREPKETPGLACPACGAIHNERARRRMLRTAKWIPTRDEPLDEDVISFTLSRLDSARSSLSQVVREWRRAVRAVERGDALGVMTWRNTSLGLAASPGGADIDALYDSRGRKPEDDIEQATCGVDVQDDRLVYAVVGFTPANRSAVVLDHGNVLGDPRDDDVWGALDSALSKPFGGLPVSITCVDAGFLTSSVRKQCTRRRWFVPTVGRAGAGKPLARRIGESGIATMGKDDASSWWSGRAASGNVYLPADISRADIRELCAAEVLVVDRGRLRWKPVDGVPNHGWDACLLAVHGRHFRPLARSTRRFRLVAV